MRHYDIVHGVKRMVLSLVILLFRLFLEILLKESLNIAGIRFLYCKELFQKTLI